MSLKLVKIEPKWANFVWITAACVCFLAGLLFIKWNLATAISSTLDTRPAESKLAAEWLVGLSPGDPQTHRTLAVALENSFDPIDFERSLGEYEVVAGLSPNDYEAWLDLGKARGRNGDIDGAEAAFSRALELAPNYSKVHWTYGNFLVRQNRVDEGFGLVAKAAAANPQYSGPAAVLALELFDGDSSRARSLLGSAEAADVALAPVLASIKRYDEAFDSWNKLPIEKKATRYRSLGEQLIGRMIDGKEFRNAARISADLAENENSKPVVGQVTNGGFENGVKIKQAGPFDWQIGEGIEPQIGLSESQKYSGNYGLWMVFNTFETERFRQVSQIVSVEPGARYKFEAYCLSALKTPAKLRIEIVNPGNGAALGSTNEISLTSTWTLLSTEIVIPPDLDGIRIQLRRDGCNGPACPAAGTLGFDDISLTRQQ